MSALARVFARVVIWRAIAAECRSAALARPQMDPLPADLDALCALMARGMLNRRDRRKMRAGSVGHHFTLFSKTHGQTEPTWSLLRPQRRRA